MAEHKPQHDSGNFAVNFGVHDLLMAMDCSSSDEEEAEEPARTEAGAAANRQKNGDNVNNQEEAEDGSDSDEMAGTTPEEKVEVTTAREMQSTVLGCCVCLLYFYIHTHSSWFNQHSWTLRRGKFLKATSPSLEQI